MMSWLMGSEICFSLHVLDDPFVFKSWLRVIKILLGRNDISIELWLEVIQGIFGWVVPFGFRFPWTHYKFMFMISLCYGEGVVAV